MRVTVIGATGSVGSRVVEQALAAGHDVTAVARRPDQLPAGVRGVELDLSTAEPAELESAVGGADAVLSCLGPRSKAEAGIVSRGARLTVAAMQAKGVKRLIVISAAPVGTVPSPARPHPPRRDPGDGFFVGNLVMPILKKVLGHVYADLAEMEDVVRGSDLEWTIVRPPQLTEKPPSGTFRTDFDQNLRGGLSIPSADLADFMLKAVDQPETVGKIVRIAS